MWLISRYLVPIHCSLEGLENGVLSENASNVFHSHYANNHRKFWICVWRKLGHGNHVIIVMSSVHTKRGAGVFKFTGVWRAFFKAPVRFRDGFVWWKGLTVEIMVWTRLKIQYVIFLLVLTKIVSKLSKRSSCYSVSRMNDQSRGAMTTLNHLNFI